jgi:hypothetical protein
MEVDRTSGRSLAEHQGQAKGTAVSASDREDLAVCP